MQGYNKRMNEEKTTHFGYREVSVRVDSRGPFRIVDPLTGRNVWKAEFRGEIQVVAAGGPRGGVPSVFRIQVGAFG